MQYYKLIAEPMHYYQLLIDNYVVGSEWQDDVVRKKLNLYLSSGESFL